MYEKMLVGIIRLSVRAADTITLEGKIMRGPTLHLDPDTLSAETRQSLEEIRVWLKWSETLPVRPIPAERRLCLEKRGVMTHAKDEQQDMQRAHR